ncbi:DNA-binding SARP family transcriptional activator [Bacilli bacterium PM5-3]|nr:DNA-binding SARP family transcriptional activator [Bacilli bacterium PM5-3]
MKFDINLLGEFSVKKDGELIKFPFKKTAILFAYLVIYKEANRKEIAALLWENVDETEVRKNLRNALYTLRKVLDQDIIKTDGNTKIYLNQDYEYNCDYLQITSSKNAIEIVSLYDHFLDSLNIDKMTNFKKWVNEVQDKLLSIYVNACDKLIIKYKEANKLDDALEMLHQKVKYHKYDEAAYRDIMRIYLEKNEFDKAIEAYATINNTLSNNLKINCEQDTIKLYEKVVNRKLSMIKTRNTNITNEENEKILNKLIDAYDSLIKYNKSSFFVLDGEPGVGKTFLINRFLTYVKKDVELFKIFCYENDEDYVFRGIEPFITELSFRFKTLSFNDLLTFAFKDANNAFSQDERYTYFDFYFIKLMKKLLDNNKIVLLVEDTNYLDISSRMLFDKLCEANLENLMIIFTYAQKSEQKNEIKCTEELYVKAWNKYDIKRFLMKKNNANKISDAQIDVIYNKTKGNPFYIRNIYKFDNIENVTKEMIYSKIYESLSNNEQHVIDILAVFIRSTSLKNLKIIVTLSNLDLIETLRCLEEKEIISSYRSKLGIVYQISSELFKEFIYNNLNKHVKNQLHNTIAYNLEANSIDVETPLYLYQILLDHFISSNNKVKELEYRIKYYSIKNYSACELFSIVEISLIDSLYLDHDDNFETLLDELENELYDISGNNIFSSSFKEMSILFYVMKARYYLMKVNNEESIKAINILMGITDNMEDIIKRHNTYYLMIYYSINANDFDNLNYILDKLLNSIRLLDTFSIEYTKSMITYSRFKGYYYMVSNNPDKAIYYLKKGLTIANNTTFNLDITYKASIYHYLGQVYIVQNKYKEAIDAFNRCLRLLMKENLLIDAVLVTRGFLSISYYLNDDIDKACENAKNFKEYQSYKNFYLKERLFDCCFDIIINKRCQDDKPVLDNNFDYQIFKLIFEKHCKN